MRITTWNVNGLRAALRKGFADHLAQIAPDVILLQEVRSLPEQLPEVWQQPVGWHVHWHPAQKKGYSGTAILSRQPLEVLGTGIDQAPDLEGRVIHARVCRQDQAGQEQEGCRPSNHWFLLLDNYLGRAQRRIHLRSDIGRNRW